MKEAGKRLSELERRMARIEEQAAARAEHPAVARHTFDWPEFNRRFTATLLLAVRPTFDTPREQALDRAVRWRKQQLAYATPDHERRTDEQVRDEAERVVDRFMELTEAEYDEATCPARPYCGQQHHHQPPAEPAAEEPNHG